MLSTQEKLAKVGIEAKEFLDNIEQIKGDGYAFKTEQGTKLYNEALCVLTELAQNMKTVKSYAEAEIDADSEGLNLNHIENLFINQLEIFKRFA